MLQKRQQTLLWPRAEKRELGIDFCDEFFFKNGPLERKRSPNIPLELSFWAEEEGKVAGFAREGPGEILRAAAAAAPHRLPRGQRHLLRYAHCVCTGGAAALRTPAAECAGGEGHFNSVLLQVRICKTGKSFQVRGHCERPQGLQAGPQASGELQRTLKWI